MTEPEPERIQFMYGYPIPTPDHATLLASHRLLLDVARECLPVRVRSTDETSYFESWEVTRAALMARMAGTLRHLGYLVPSSSRLDGLALARTLLDHVIAFTWVSADPRQRLPALLRSSFKDLLAKDRGYRDRGQASLLGDAERERLSAYTRKVTDEMPGLPRRSREADDYWPERVRSALPEELHIVAFERMYHDIYDHYAASDHPSTLGLQVFVHLGGNPVVVTVDGEPVRDREADLRPYWLAVFSFAQALVVSNLAAGRPRVQALRRALGTIGTMRKLEREGRLSVTVQDDGTVSIGAPDDDEGAEAG